MIVPSTWMFVSNNFLQNSQDVKIFFCGIGGIGTSALALLAINHGYQVIGSNEEENKNTMRLKDLGVDVVIGHRAENLRDCNIFVYSRAVDISTNIEAIEAVARHIPMFERGEMLSILMQNYYNIVIAGSHGKTTTTGFIGHSLNALGLKPNILIGGILNSNNLNCKIDNGKYFVVESDESDGSFLKMPSNIGIITNIDPEHMEFYKTKENLEYYFRRFAKNCLQNDGLIVCVDDEIGRHIFNENIKNSNILAYSIQDENADFYATNIRYKKNGLFFDAKINILHQEIKDVFISNMFGKINASNALASFAVGYLLKQDQNKIAKSFSNFYGIQKRFTILGTNHNTLIVDDYAHNPQKIACAIESARHYMTTNNMQGKLIVVFEPHRYTRIRDSIELFVKILQKADIVITLPIYASSEMPIEGITDEFVYKKCKEGNKNTFSSTLDCNSIEHILKEINAFDKENLIVFMGAGKSSKLAHDFVKNEL